ncbi:hypothetical protein [Streptomyces sp. NBC_01497]|uniref:hypothetical protein n=1 Tax=Streptomyces sp. NBC_01497 TaxID=2903885 RepID=UPI002E36496E|nr:hypothetical protein [Streptomyces sp. NBC_01497]
MPRGRHRHSPPLHKLLPPSAVAAVAVVCAGGVWAVDDPLLLRGLAVVAGVAALTGAVLMRGWDRDAGHRVAELTRARESDQWKTDERVAELEADVDEAREIRTRLDGKLRAKRVELARLRGEHAALLRRYATAETERASALEGRRRLAIAATVTPRALAAGGTLTPSAYLMASRALDELAANGARQTALPAPRERLAVESAARRADDAPAAGGTDAASPAPASGQRSVERAVAEPAERRTDAGPAAEAQDPAEGRPALPARRATSPSAIVPYARRTQHRPEQRPGGKGFDFFGMQHGGRVPPEGSPEAGREHAEAPEADDRPDADAGGLLDSGAQRDVDAQRDLGEQRDVDAQRDLGEQRDVDDQKRALADRRGLSGQRDAGDGDGGHGDTGSEVIDLTEHDDTERLEVHGLRSALGS